MKSTLSPIILRKLLIRADYRCEYCKCKLNNQTCQIDHIIPTSRYGDDSTSNFAITCSRCNINKSNKIEYADPYTWSNFPLFNPRKMTWNNHFHFTNNEIAGRTNIGRATSSLLFRDTPQYIPGDLKWDKIQQIDSESTIYKYLNNLRYLRLRNRFDELFNEIRTPIIMPEIANFERQIYSFSLEVLLLELFFTRSNLTDIKKGIKYGLNLLHKYKYDPINQNEIYGLLAILFQQYATIQILLGEEQKAANAQKISHKYYLLKHPICKDGLITLHNPKVFANSLRALTIGTKYESFDLSNVFFKSSINMLSDLNPKYSVSHWCYLIDSLLLHPKPPLNILELCYENISFLIKKEGYGTSYDFANLIILRRRWWYLHLMLHSKPWLGTLCSDLKFWYKLDMMNEIRELLSYIKRRKEIVHYKLYRELNEIFPTSRIF